jgi:hypothetical protein
VDLIEMPAQLIVSFVVPYYNEQVVLPHALRELLDTLRELVSEGIILENN